MSKSLKTQNLPSYGAFNPPTTHTQSFGTVNFQLAISKRGNRNFNIHIYNQGRRHRGARGAASPIIFKKKKKEKEENGGGGRKNEEIITKSQ